ncbi:MAG: hypothetical protein DWQ04_18905 [Chloroflexi bacterium]|nr:MAG: hypothetical protein DWQ04_18905 [Chloroflexota bacterium]
MNRLEWILGIMLVLLLIVVVVLSLLFWFRPDSTQVVGAPNSATTIAQKAQIVEPTPVFEGRTAKIAFAAARNRAALWQADAELLTASATFSQGATPEILLAGETSWAFSFYSPTSGKSATFSVIENDATLVGTGSSEQVYTPLNITNWQLDSDDAVGIMLESGGKEMIEEEGITILTMALLAGNQNDSNELEWLVSLIAPQNGRILDLRLNAVSGEMIEIIQVP